jgi:putative transposase
LKVKRAYKTELNPNKSQLKMLSQHAGAARFAFNWGLAKKIAAYELIGRSPTAIDLHRELNSLKKTDFPWPYEVSKCAPQEALRDLDRAFVNFFRRCALKNEGKHNGKVGYPRFKSKRQGLGSFRLTGSIHAEPSRIKLPRLPWIRLKEKGYLPCERNEMHILSATVSERAGRWFVSLQVEEELPDPEVASGPPVGIDLGLRTLAVVCSGEGEHAYFDNPKALFKAQRKIGRLQKKLSRQQKGSGRREETRRRIAAEHYRVSCVRQDALNKATSQIVAKTKPPSQRPALIGIEDLNVSGMMKNHRLARSVADASWREFRRQMEYKCSWYGIELVTVPRFEPTSKTCSRCGHKRENLSLSERTFRCPSCGYTADRDENAASNIRSLAASSAERINGHGEDTARAPSVKCQLKLAR